MAGIRETPDDPVRSSPPSVRFSMVSSASHFDAVDGTTGVRAGGWRGIMRWGRRGDKRMMGRWDDRPRYPPRRDARTSGTATESGRMQDNDRFPNFLFFSSAFNTGTRLRRSFSILFRPTWVICAYPSVRNLRACTNPRVPKWPCVELLMVRTTPIFFQL